MWPFKSKTNYPINPLPAKALDLLNRMDNVLVSNSVQNDDELSIIQLDIGLIHQFHSVDRLFKMMKLPTGYYLPRSIAFNIAPDGTWQHFIGIRNGDATNTVTNNLWLHLLTETNAARSIEA